MGTSTGGMGEEEHFLSDNPPPPTHTKATCPWRKTRCHYSHHHSHGPFVTERKREGRAHPSPKRASRQATGSGTCQSTQLVIPTVPLVFCQPAPLKVPVEGAGKGKGKAGGQMPP